MIDSNNVFLDIMKQCTIVRQVSIEGIGLHTRKMLKLTFCPAPVNHRFRFRVFMGLDDNRSFRYLRVQALNVRPHIPPIDVALSNDDAIPIRDTHNNALFVRVDGLRLIIIRLIDIETYFLDEGRGDNEEDEHDEHNVQHRREVDLFVRLLFPASAEYPSHVLPPGTNWEAILTRVRRGA